MPRKKAAPIIEPAKPRRGRPPRAPSEGIDGQLGARIKAARIAKGWSAEELSERSGVSWGNIYSAEAGRNSMTIGTLDKLATALGVRPDKLLRGL